MNFFIDTIEVWLLCFILLYFAGTITRTAGSFCLMGLQLWYGILEGLGYVLYYLFVVPFSFLGRGGGFVFVFLF